MVKTNNQTVHAIETEGGELAGAGEVMELGEVGETKGGFGSSGDGHGGLLNPED
jgi:hypothetical protein